MKYCMVSVYRLADNTPDLEPAEVEPVVEPQPIVEPTVEPQLIVEPTVEPQQQFRTNIDQVRYKQVNTFDL